MIAYPFSPNDHRYPIKAFVDSLFIGAAMGVVRWPHNTAVPSSFGAATTFANNGGAGFGASGVVATVTAFATRHVRGRLTNISGANQAVRLSHECPLFRRVGGGFFAQSVFIPTGGNNQSTMLVGLGNNFAPSGSSNTEPSAISNFISFIVDSTDTNWQLCWKGTGTAVKVDTGIRRSPIVANDNDVLRVTFVNDGTDLSVTCTIEMLNPDRPMTFTRVITADELLATSFTTTSALIFNHGFNTGPSTTSITFDHVVSYMQSFEQ